MFKKILSLTVIICFFLSTLCPYPQAHADTILGLPVPGAMVNLSPVYEPVMIKGLTVHKDNPFLFDFIVDVGQDKMSGEPLKKEGEKLIKYFLASLAIPDKDVWVNLSPYEKNRMIPEALGQTDMGRDLLEQDYILKQITASLIYPEKDLGKKFWDKVYTKAQEMYGTTQVPVNTFNKVWIMADRAEVFEHNQTAFVVDSHLKVMLEEDYLALNKNGRQAGLSTKTPQGNNPNAIPATHSIASQIVKQIILPELEKEVNTGKNFANLRQILNSLILANWYKNNLKQALLNQVYTNQSKVKGIDLNDPSVKQQIYEQYLKAYKKGVFNYIKEDVSPGPDSKKQGVFPRKYFSGGFDEAMAVINPRVTLDFAVLAGTLPKQNNRFEILTTVASINKPTVQPQIDAAMTAEKQALIRSDAAMLDTHEHRAEEIKAIDTMIKWIHSHLGGLNDIKLPGAYKIKGIIVWRGIEEQKFSQEAKQIMNLSNLFVLEHSNLQLKADSHTALFTRREETFIYITSKGRNGHSLDYETLLGLLGKWLIGYRSDIETFDKSQNPSVDKAMMGERNTKINERIEALGQKGVDISTINFLKFVTRVAVGREEHLLMGNVELLVDILEKENQSQQDDENFEDAVRRIDQKINELLVPGRPDAAMLDTYEHRAEEIKAIDTMIKWIHSHLGGLNDIKLPGAYKIKGIIVWRGIEEQKFSQEAKQIMNLSNLFVLEHSNLQLRADSYTAILTRREETFIYITSKVRNGHNLDYETLLGLLGKWLIGYRRDIEAFDKSQNPPVDRASLAKVSTHPDRVVAAHADRVTPGGIDLNISNGMQWTIDKEGKKFTTNGAIGPFGVEMNVDPAMIARIQREGINWLEPVILRMTPVTSIWPLVGLQAPAR